MACTLVEESCESFLDEFEMREGGFTRILPAPLGTPLEGRISLSGLLALYDSLPTVDMTSRILSRASNIENRLDNFHISSNEHHDDDKRQTATAQQLKQATANAAKAGKVSQSC